MRCISLAWGVACARCPDPAPPNTIFFAGGFDFLVSSYARADDELRLSPATAPLREVLQEAKLLAVRWTNVSLITCVLPSDSLSSTSSQSLSKTHVVSLVLSFPLQR